MYLYRNLLVLAALIAPHHCFAINVAVRLQNGDHVTGVVIKEQSDRLILSNQWAGALEIPKAQIQNRSELETTQTSPTLPEVTKTQSRPTPASKPGNLWKADAQLGLDLAYGIRDRQIFHGRIRTEYKRPYERDPKQSARLNLEYSGEYGRTDREISANRMEGRLNSEFDLNQRFFLNDEGRLGYDQIRRVDLSYEFGPGLGYHLIQKPGLSLNTIFGINYQAEFESDGTDNRAVYLRFAQDFKWQITEKVIFDEKLEYFPSVENIKKYRARLEANMRYKLLQNLSLNLTLQDYYDTQPARDVNENELKIRSALGLNF